MDVIKEIECQLQNDISFEQEISIINDKEIKRDLDEIFKKMKNITEADLNKITSNERVLNILRTYLIENDIEIISEDFYNSAANNREVLADPVKQYFAEIGQIPLLTIEEEKEIFKRRDLAKTEEERKQINKEISEHNLRLVVSIARRYNIQKFESSLSLLDLIQEGNEGLIKAVDKFEVEKGYKFSTYATWWIRQSIGRCVNDKGRTIRIPVHMVESINKINRVKRALSTKYGRDITQKELADALGMTIEELKKLQSHDKEMLSFDYPIGDEDDASVLGDFIADEDGELPEDAAIKSLLADDVHKMIDTLDDRAKTIMVLRYGLDGEGSRTLEEIGKMYGITRERVRQIEAKTLRHMRVLSKKRKIRNYID